MKEGLPVACNFIGKKAGYILLAEDGLGITVFLYVEKRDGFAAFPGPLPCKEFDYDCGVSRSHRSRRWRCEAVLRITPAAYHYDVLIKDSKSLETIQRHRIKTTPCLRPLLTGIGFSKIRWDGSQVVDYTSDDKEVFRFNAALPTQHSF